MLAVEAVDMVSKRESELLIGNDKNHSDGVMTRDTRERGRKGSSWPREVVGERVSLLWW